jgi:hypothetical protein
VMPQRWPELQAQFIDQHFTKDTREGFWRAGKALSVNGSYWLAFGLRHGALYEPTAALHRLLEATDVGPDIPLRLILPPAPALCIVPPPSVRDAPDGFRSVTVFDSPVPSGPGAPPRCLTFIIETARRTDTLTVAVHGGDETMAEGFALACERITFLLSKSQDLDVEQECRIALRQLTYVAKLLLYMSLDAAAVRLDRAYTDADRSFSGLGRRKREQRQAQIELLYDRYVVGPAVLADGAASSAGDHAGTEVSAHWRRGHFRMQTHGPQSSLRKLMFIAPTLVRPDRLPEL